MSFQADTLFLLEKKYDDDDDDDNNTNKVILKYPLEDHNLKITFLINSTLPITETTSNIINSFVNSFLKQKWKGYNIN